MSPLACAAPSPPVSALLKAMHSVVAVVRPLAMVFPAWMPAEHILSLLLVVLICFLIGVAVRTPAGHALQERLRHALFDHLPGFALVRSLTQRLAGHGEENVWQPAPCISLAGTACIPWMSPSPRRSGRSPAGGQGPKTWSPL